MVQQLQVARIDGLCLIRIATDDISVTDIVGPSSTTVCLSGEWVGFGGSLWSPRAAQAGGSEGTEITTLGSDGLDDHEISVLTLDGVNFDSLEKVVGGVGHDDGECGTEAAWEVSNGHAGAVDSAVVSAEEEIHVGAITDECLIDGTSV